MKKSPKDSELTISQVMIPSHSNVAGHVFGGEILKFKKGIERYEQRKLKR